MDKLKYFFILQIQILLILFSPVFGNSTNVLNYDVVIIGSGLTGLTAAREIRLKNPSTSVLVLEASNISGGRIRGQPLSITKEDSSKKQMVDIGAIWISPSHNEIIELAKEFNLDLYSQANSCGEKVIFVNNNATNNFRFKRQSDWNSLPGGGKSISDLSSPTIFNELSSRSCENFINSQQLMESTKDSVFRFLQTFYDAPANSISALQLLLTLASENEDIQTMLSNQGHGKSMIMKNSLQSLINELTKDTLINYNQEVSSVSILNDNGVVIQNNSLPGSQVSITTSNGQNYLAQEVIVAISPHAISKINFEPQLNKSEHDFLSNYTSYGDAYYFVASYTSPFWRNNKHSGQIIFSDQTGSNSLYWMTTFDISEDNNCQVENNLGLLYGIAHFASELNEEERLQAYIKIINQNLGNQTDELIDIKDIQWTKQQYVNGLVGVIPVDGIKNMSQLTTNYFLKRIHFASPELSLKSMGSPNGAVYIGKEIANVVLQEMASLPEIKLQDDSSNRIVINNVTVNDNNSETTISPFNEEETKETETFHYNTTPHYTEETILIKSTTTQSYESTTLYPNAFVYNTSQHYFEQTTVDQNFNESYSQQITNNQTTQFPQITNFLNDNENELTTSTVGPIENISSNETHYNSTVFQYSTTPHYELETTSSNLMTKNPELEPFNDDINTETTIFVYNTTPHYPVESTTDPSTQNFNNTELTDKTTISSIESSTFPYSTSSHYPEESITSSSTDSVTTSNHDEIHSTITTNLNNSFDDNSTTKEFSSDSLVTQKYADAISRVQNSGDINEINALISQIQTDIPKVGKMDRLKLIKQLNELIDMLIDSIENDQNN
uniref:monoamine oxidase n=1 Tax=Strongyloides papillosus TaxID=174720 RepID=A0A0N5BWK2_STREA